MPTLYMEYLIGVLSNADTFQSIRDWANAELEEELSSHQVDLLDLTTEGN